MKTTFAILNILSVLICTLTPHHFHNDITIMTDLFLLGYILINSAFFFLLEKKTIRVVFLYLSIMILVCLVSTVSSSDELQYFFIRLVWIIPELKIMFSPDSSQILNFYLFTFVLITILEIITFSLFKCKSISIKNSENSKTKINVS